MQFYYDIHCHILPGADDGAVDMEETRRMLLIAYEEGIRVIVATPHFFPGKNNQSTKELKLRLEEVNQLAGGVSKEFKVILGNELFYSVNLIEELKNGSALTINNTRYILIEFEPEESYKTIREGLLQFLYAGYLPILAHTERYQCLTKNMGRVIDIVGLGAYIQINFSSFIGRRMDPRVSFSHKLIKHKLVHLLGTDAHNTAERPPHVKDAINYIKRKYGGETVRQLVWENPTIMLMDKPI